MNGSEGTELESSVFQNGKPPVALHSTPSSPSTDQKFEELTEEDFAQDDPPVVQIERDLDELTYSGAAINDLEIQLTRTKHFYQQVLVDGKRHVDVLRRKLHSHIVKSDPFIEIWRQARQVQDMSNKAAARYDKANSQHTAAKEMIRVAESQLDACREEQDAYEEPSSPSPLDLAWQEMLNHATAKVVVTERERRDSELEHRMVLEDCKKVMEEYRIVERKLRSHIVKSRPYFQERYRVNQQLAKLKETMKNLERRINETKQTYSASLKRLEVLNTELHDARRVAHSSHRLDPRQVSSTGTSPEMRRHLLSKTSEEDDVGSLQLNAADYSGSTGSLPSIGILSNSEQSDSDTRSLDNLDKVPLYYDKVPGLYVPPNPALSVVPPTPSPSPGPPSPGTPSPGTPSQGPGPRSSGPPSPGPGPSVVPPNQQDYQEDLGGVSTNQGGLVPSSENFASQDRISANQEDLEEVPSKAISVVAPHVHPPHGDPADTPHKDPPHEDTPLGDTASCVVSECDQVANDLVGQCLATAVRKLSQHASSHSNSTLT